MPVGNLIGRIGRSAALAGAVVAGVAFTAPQPAQAISAGEAAGIGVGAFALGTLLGSQPSYAYPAYPAYSYPPGYAYPPGYYPGYAPRQCWDPYYGRYYYC